MIVTVSTELPIPAATGWELIQKTELLRYVMRGLIAFRGDVPQRWPTEGESVTVRLWFLGVLPAWKHTIRIVRWAGYEGQTSEHGGPVHVWNHSVRFEALGASTCRYTDEIHIEAGALTPIVGGWAHLQYRYRQMRWRGLARVLA